MKTTPRPHHVHLDLDRPLLQVAAETLASAQREGARVRSGDRRGDVQLWRDLADTAELYASTVDGPGADRRRARRLTRRARRQVVRAAAAGGV